MHPHARSNDTTSQAGADHNPRSDLESCPMNNLPPELLLHIFELVLERQICENEKDHYGRPQNLPRFQLIASHVCHYWRNVALSFPSLWTAIWFPRVAWPKTELVSLMVKRSEPQPIEIHVHPEYRHTLSPFPYHVLLPHIHRWRSLKVNFHSKEHELSFLNALSHPSSSAASQLTTLILHRYDRRPATSKRFTLFNGSAPLLSSVILWGILVDWNQPWISSASNLTTLELGCHRDHNRPSWAQFSTALRNAPALQKLVLFSSGPSGMPVDWLNSEGPDRNPNSPIPLLNLTEFMLGWDCPARAIGFLRMFCMPALRKLTLKLNEHDYSDFVRVLAGSATSLTLPSLGETPRSLLRGLEELNIVRLTCHPDVQRLLYDELQDLKSLTIPICLPSSVDPPMDFARLLLPRERDEGGVRVSLPGLDTLTLVISMAYYDFELPHEVVLRRKDAGFPLRSFCMNRVQGLSGNLKRWFTENVEEFNPCLNVGRYDPDPWCR